MQGSKPANASAKPQHKCARHVASEILLKVDTQKAYADILLDHALKGGSFDERDRALLTELVYGTLRWRGSIDAKLSAQMRRPLTQADPFLRNLLRATLYQVIYLDKIPDYAAVNQAVELAKLRGVRAAGFVNGVLRNILRHNKVSDPAPSNRSSGALAEQFSHPEWLVKRWLNDLGIAEAIPLMRANNERAQLTLRVNALKCTREKLLEMFLTAGIAAQPTRSSPRGISILSNSSVAELPGFSEGFFQVQGEASQLVTELLAPAAGERILDACAAPGGKSTHIAELMGDQGTVIALDNSERGLRRIHDNVTRLQLKSVHAIQGDASVKLSGRVDGAYDRILVDAPCSGLGTLRSRPEIKWQRDESDIERLGRLQSKILANVTKYLKIGGVLVYSTCTLSSDENDRVIEEFLHQHSEFELEDAARYLPDEARPMTRERYFQALPHRDNTDGFFAARMRKAS